MKSWVTYIATACVTIAPGWGQAQAPASLTWDNFKQVENYLKLKPADENYQKITWHSTVIKGHRTAQREDKPLLLWLYFGDPRGNC